MNVYINYKQIKKTINFHKKRIYLKKSLYFVLKIKSQPQLIWIRSWSSSSGKNWEKYKWINNKAILAIIDEKILYFIRFILSIIWFSVGKRRPENEKSSSLKKNIQITVNVTYFGEASTVRDRIQLLYFIFRYLPDVKYL